MTHVDLYYLFAKKISCLLINIFFNLLFTGQYLFNAFALSDLTAGVILLVGSLTVLCGCLICLVKVLSTLLKGKLGHKFNFVLIIVMKA